MAEQQIHDNARAGFGRLRRLQDSSCLRRVRPKPRHARIEMQRGAQLAIHRHRGRGPVHELAERAQRRRQIVLCIKPRRVRPWRQSVEHINGWGAAAQSLAHAHALASL